MREREEKQRIIALIIIIILIVIMIALVSKSMKKAKNTAINNAIELQIQDTATVSKATIDSLTPCSLYREILKQEIAHPDIVWAQAILESGWLKKHTNNNLFGMQKPKRRPNLVLSGSPDNYAHYMSWIDSVIDYKLWQEYCQTDKLCREAYLSFLARHYAKDKNYINKIKLIIDNNQSIL